MDRWPFLLNTGRVWKKAWPGATLHITKAKRVRFALVNVAGRFSRDRRKISLRLAATIQWTTRFIRLFARFPPATPPTG